MITVNKLRQEANIVKRLAELADRQAKKGLLFEAIETLRAVCEESWKTLEKIKGGEA